MYSYEDHIRAVKLYIKVGKRIGVTIRQLGYPTKNSLKSWHAEYERCLDLPRGYENSKSKYSLAQREKAVGHYLEYGRSIAATIKALGYPARDSLRAWIYEIHPELHTRVVGRSDGLARPPAVKQAAVIALCTRKESAKALAQKLGVCRPTLYNWKNQLFGPEVSPSMKRRLEPSSSPEREELERQLKSLQLDVRRLQLEHDLLMRANELLKKETGIDRQVLTNREKTLLADALRQRYSLLELLDALGLARSSYFYLRAQSSLLWLPSDASFAKQAARAPFREGGAALDEAGVPGRRQAETASIRFLPRGDQSCAGKPRQS